MHHEASLLSNTTLWYAFAVIGFALLLFFTARKAIVGVLDAGIAKVVAELDEAKRLRAEADKALQDYRIRQHHVEQEAESILEQARADAARLHDAAKAELEATLKRQEQQAMDRIRIVQEEAAADIRRFILDMAMKDVRGKLLKGEASAESAKMIDQIIEKLPKLTNNKVA